MPSLIPFWAKTEAVSNESDEMPRRELENPRIQTPRGLRRIRHRDDRQGRPYESRWSHDHIRGSCGITLDAAGAGTFTIVGVR